MLWSSPAGLRTHPSGRAKDTVRPGSPTRCRPLGGAEGPGPSLPAQVLGGPESQGTSFPAARVLGGAEGADVAGAGIDAFVTHNLSDPDLSPATTAAQHHISVRLPHVLFEEESETVGATIRRRLERTRTDLADPRLRHRTIGEIVLRWGFRHPADFSRAFRRAYGTSSSDFRHTA